MEISPEVSTVIDGNPIINNAFVEPTRYWHFSGVTPSVREGRRTAGYLAPSPDGQLKIPDDVIPLFVVNDLRNRVRQWRNDGYQGASTITRDLFQYWFEDERIASSTRPFFAQQEAVETVVLLVEAPDHPKVGIDVPGSGEAYTRNVAMPSVSPGVFKLSNSWTCR
jgi:type III restriction enzyme